MQQDSCGFGRNPINVIVYYPLLWSHSELPNWNMKNRWTGDYFVMTCSTLTLQPPVTIETARPPISTGNIEVTVRDLWLKEL